MFREEFAAAMQEIIKIDRNSQQRLYGGKRKLSAATGKLAYAVIREAAEEVCKVCPELTIRVYPIRNDFFGETITVAGLVTGQDLIAQLRKRQQAGEDLGDTLLLPANMLRSGEQVFLDDVTVQDVERALGLTVTVTEPTGAAFAEAALNPDYHMERENDADSFVYVQGYDR